MEFIIATIATWWFWILLIWIIITSFCVVADHATTPAIGFIAGLAILHFFGGVPVWAFVKGNWGSVLVYASIYVVAGLGWSFFKWYMYLVDKKDAFKKELERVKRINQQRDQRDMEKIPFPVVPKARDNKEKITTWMIYWPFSMFGFIFADMVKRAYDALYKLFGNLYDRIAQHVFKGLEG